MEPNKKKGINTYGSVIMAVIAFKEKSHMLAEEYGWPLPSAKGYVDGEAFRKRRWVPPIHALVGIDDYSEGFRAGYYHRPISERALLREPSNPSSEGSLGADVRVQVVEHDLGCA